MSHQIKVRAYITDERDGDWFEQRIVEVVMDCPVAFHDPDSEWPGEIDAYVEEGISHNLRDLVRSARSDGVK